MLALATSATCCSKGRPPIWPVAARGASKYCVSLSAGATHPGYYSGCRTCTTFARTPPRRSQAAAASSASKTREPTSFRDMNRTDAAPVCNGCAPACGANEACRKRRKRRKSATSAHECTWAGRNALWHKLKATDHANGAMHASCGRRERKGWRQHLPKESPQWGVPCRQGQHLREGRRSQPEQSALKQDRMERRLRQQEERLQHRFVDAGPRVQVVLRGQRPARSCPRKPAPCVVVRTSVKVIQPNPLIAVRHASRESRKPERVESSKHVV